MQNFKKPEFWIYPVLAVGLWAFFAFAMPDVLEFWEKNQLFRFSSDYWHFFDHEPFGTLIYLHTFLIQFSYYPWLGAIVYALLFTLTAWLFNRCIAIKGNRRLLPGLLSVALLLPTTANFGLLVLMVVLFTVLGAHSWIYWQNLVLRYWCQVLVLAGLTYLVREYMVWVLPFYICLDWGRTKQSGQKFNPLFLLIPLAGTALAWGLGSWLCAPYDFIYSDNLFQFFGKSFSPNSIPYFFFAIHWFVAISMIGFSLLSFVFAFYYPKFLKIYWFIGFLLIIGEAWFTKVRSQPITDFQKVDRLCRAYRWEEALHQLDLQWKKTPVVIPSSKAHQLFFGQTKLALLATRKATSRLFTYPQPVFPMLFPLSMNNKPEWIILPSYYIFAGGFSESLHLNYDLVTCHDISANVLNSIIITSIIVNDTIPMLKLNYFLEKSLFYRQQTKIYKDSFLRNAIPAVERGKRMLPSHNYSVFGYSPDVNAFRQYFNQPQNPYFYEYFLTICLLYKKHATIMDELPTIKKFYQKGDFFEAPRHIQEALLATFNYAPLRFLYPTRISGVSKETWNDYWFFIADNQSYFNGKTSFSELQEKWGHTYWFYDCYLNIVDMESKSSQSVN